MDTLKDEMLSSIPGIVKEPEHSAEVIPIETRLNMDERMACLIVAGYDEQNRRMIKGIDGKTYFKQQVPIDGKPLLSYPIKAALESQRVSNVYIVGNPDIIESAVKAAHPENRLPQRVKIIRQIGSVTDNIQHSIEEYIRPYNDRRKEKTVEHHPSKNVVVRQPPNIDDRVLILTSDTCFIKGYDIDDFIDHAGFADFIGSFAQGCAYDCMIKELELDIDRAKTKTLMFPLANGPVRSNNMFLVRYSYVAPQMYQLFQNVYDSRKITDEHGRMSTKKLLELIKDENRLLREAAIDMSKRNCTQRIEDEIAYCYRKGDVFVLNNSITDWKEYILPGRAKRAVGRGIINEYGCMFAFYLAYKIYKLNDRISDRMGMPLIPNIPRALMLWDRDLEKTASELLANSLTVSIHRTNRIGPMLDIDVQEMYDILAKDDFSNFKRIRDYLQKER